MTVRGPRWSRTRPTGMPATAETTRAAENAAVVASADQPVSAVMAGVEDGEGVVDDAPAGDLGDAEGGQDGARPRPDPRPGRGRAALKVASRGQQPPEEAGRRRW